MSHDRSTSAGRYAHRLDVWKESGVLFPRTRYHGWWLIHNVVSHPLLGVSHGPRVVWFHDWTSQYLNRRPRLRPSPPPAIPEGKRLAWTWHNVAGHLAIGLLPIPRSFAFHDRGAEAMGVEDWV